MTNIIFRVLKLDLQFWHVLYDNAKRGSKVAKYNWL